jgi:ubiquinone/menaquinone biosynthesis C-methylase UbiE
MQKTDYKQIAPTYNNRYEKNYLVNIENEIRNIILTNKCKAILEAGCGTGRWIGSLKNESKKIFGLDYSFDMLKIPKADISYLNLVNADAVHIPFKKDFFDLIFCVNAIHHFPDKEEFIKECNRTLSNKGILAVFSVDPHIDKDWYVYDYFDSVYENDLKRFPSLRLLKILLKTEKLTDIEFKVVEEIHNERVGNEVFNDPFLNKNHCSQLANLSDEEYQKGIERIKNQINKNPETNFRTSVIFYLINAKKIRNRKCQ